MPKIDKKLKRKILQEVMRISKTMYEEEHLNLQSRKSFMFIQNCLCGILWGDLTVNDFHDKISSASEKIRTFYYELLYQEKV